MVAKQLKTPTLLGSRPAPVRENSESSLVEVSHPRKRVRMSLNGPQWHRYVTEPPQESGSAFRQQKSNTGISTNEFQSEWEQPHHENHHEQDQKRRIQDNQEWNSWLSRRELSYFRSSAKELSKSVNLDFVLQDIFDESFTEADLCIRTNKLLQSDDFLVQRGLERWSSNHHSFIRNVKILQVKSVVFLEQATQVLSGRPDPERLSKVTVEASKSSQRFAQVLATVDEEMAMEVHASDLEEAFENIMDDFLF